MKNFFKSLFLNARVAFCALMLALTAAPAFAQVSDPISQRLIDGTATGLQGIVPGIVRVLKIIVLIGGAISLLLVVFNIIQGERDSAKKAGWWLVGLVIGFIALTLLGGTTVS